MLLGHALIRPAAAGIHYLPLLTVLSDHDDRDQQYDWQRELRTASFSGSSQWYDVNLHVGSVSLLI
jgi:hypothetical protein